MLETEEMATEMLELCEAGQQHVRLLPEDEAEEPPGTEDATDAKDVLETEEGEDAEREDATEEEK